MSNIDSASPRAFLDRFLEGVEDPNARLVRGGRLAALGFCTGAVTSIPVNLLLAHSSLTEALIGSLVLVLGIICVLIKWEDHSEYLLYSLGIVAIAIIALATVVTSLAYALNYAFVALIVALVASFRVLLMAIGLITLGLLAPAIVGDNAGRETFAFAVICAPTLLVTSTLVFQLTRMLERSRQGFWALSRQDGLTGVGNYRALIERLDEEIARHGRYGRQFSIVLLDLDNFKQVNDEFGHLIGDQVLTEVARKIRESIRTEDSVYRQGGDEFAVIAPETGAAEIQPIVDRLRARVPVTVGTGVASFPADGTSAKELIGMADIRLLDGKRDRGGNGVTTPA
jgi:diguanylate cyclase (GGDEF)-like protein